MPKIEDVQPQTPSEPLLGPTTEAGAFSLSSAELAMGATNTSQSSEGDGQHNHPLTVKDIEKAVKEADKAGGVPPYAVYIDQLSKVYGGAQKEPKVVKAYPKIKLTDEMQEWPWNKPSPGKSYCIGPKGQKMESLGDGVWKDIKTGKQWSKKLTGWAPIQSRRDRRRARAAKNARYFKGHIVGGYTGYKHIATPKGLWMRAQVGTPAGYINLMVKHNDGKDIYTVTRTSVKDFKTETVVSGDLDSKVKVKKSKGAKAQIKDMQDSIWKVLSLYDAFKAKAWTGPVDKDGVPTENKKYKEIDPTLVAAGYFKKGVPIHCECGKHTTHDDDGREISCKDFADAIDAMRGMVSL